MEGKVKWFNRTKAYGFIEGEDGEEYFVHKSQLAEGTFIRENDKVSFEPAETDKGKQAQNVVLLQKGSEIEGQEGEDQPEEAPQEEPAEEQPAEEEQKQE